MSNNISQKDVKKALRGAGVSGKTKSDLLEQFGNKSEIKRKDFEKSLRGKGGVGSYVSGRLNDNTKSQKEFNSPRLNTKDVNSGKSASKPKTSWWQAISNKNTTQSQENNTANKPKKTSLDFGSKTSSKDYDSLSKQFGSAKKGIGYTSDRGSNKSKRQQKTSLGGFKKLH